MSTFYVLPPRSFLGQSFARSLSGLFPGLTWEGEARDNLADGLASAATYHRDVYVIFREEIPDNEDPERALCDGFGAEAGDEVVEMRPAERAGTWTARRWRIGSAVAA